MTFSDLFQNQKKGFILLTHTTNTDSAMAKINAHVLEKIMHLNILDLPEDEIKKVLGDFFVELNWQLYSKFRMSIMPEHGISCMLTILYHDKVFIVQFGRLLAGIIQNDDLREIGKAWNNFPIKTKEDLYLLGSMDRDIYVKVHTHKLQSDTALFALPAADAINLSSEFRVDLNCLQNYLTSKKKEESSPFFMVQYRHSGTNEGSFFRRFWGRK